MPTPTEQPRAPIQRKAGGGVLGFNGELLEPFIGRYLLGSGYRAYSPVLMCFNKPDDMSPFSRGGLNAYAYCLGDPVNAVDPTGHSTWFTGFLSGQYKGFGRSFWGSKLNGSPFSADEISLLQKKTSRHLSHNLEKFAPLQLADMRKISPDFRENIDTQADWIYTRNRHRETGLWYPTFDKRAGDVDAAINIARGGMPGVAVSYAGKMMPMTQAKWMFAHEKSVDLEVRVGVGRRLEAFEGKKNKKQEIRGE